jgi:hypothetical protein
VSVKETADGILLQPVRRESGLIRKDGILIHRGSPGDRTSIDWNKLIEEDREERIRHIAGL